MVENLTDGAHVGHDGPDGPKEGGVVSPANVFVLSHQCLLAFTILNPLGVIELRSVSIEFRNTCFEALSPTVLSLSEE